MCSTLPNLIDFLSVRTLLTSHKIRMRIERLKINYNILDLKILNITALFCRRIPWYHDGEVSAITAACARHICRLLVDLVDKRRGNAEVSHPCIYAIYVYTKSLLLIALDFICIAMALYLLLYYLFFQLRLILIILIIKFTLVRLRIYVCITWKSKERYIDLKNLKIREKDFSYTLAGNNLEV